MAIFASLLILTQTGGAADSTPVVRKIVLAEVQPEEKLIDLASERFKIDISKQHAFDELFQNVETGDKIDLHDTEPDHEDPGTSDSWSDKRNIPAEWIEWLCADRKASAKVSPRGIDLAYVKVIGFLNLANLKISFPISTFKCVFTDAKDNKDKGKKKINMDHCSIRGLQLQSTYIYGLNGSSLNVEKDLILYDFHSTATVFLRNATIGGSVLCDGTWFNHDPVSTDPKSGLAPALNLSFARIGGGLDLRNCHALGGLVIDGAQIEGTVDCEGGTFDGRADDKANSGLTNAAIFAESIRVAGDVRFRKGFRAERGVVIRGASIGGKLDCQGGYFHRDWDPAIDADSIKVGSDVFLKSGFNSIGQVELRGATIGGNLDCDGGHFERSNSEKASGSPIPRLDHTIIPALTVASAKIEGSVLLRSDPATNTDFTATGDLDFLTARIGRSLELMSDIPLDKESHLILRDAKAEVLLNGKTSWPRKGKLNLDGFIFSIIDKEALPGAETELQWLNKQKTHGFSSQPYEQMAAVLRSMGLQEGCG